MGKVKVTEHGEKRTKERLGIPKHISDKNAEKAKEFGLSHSELKGNLKKYVTGIYLRNKDKAGAEIKIYHRYVYIFRGNTLITTYQLPTNLNNICDALEKKKEEKNGLR